MLMGLVEERQRSSDNPDQTKILIKFLAIDIWLEFTVAELEVFLKLEVFQGFPTDTLVIWF